MSEKAHKDILRIRGEMLLTLVLTLVLFVVLLLALLRPKVAELTRLDEQIEQIDARLGAAVNGQNGLQMRQRLLAAQREKKGYEQQLQESRDYFHTFRNSSDFSPDTRLTRGGRIDFKVALLEAHSHLEKISEERGVGLPYDLGMDETIETDEKTESRMWQLAAMIKLIEQVLDLGVQEVIRVRPFAPLQYPDAEGEGLTIREFPAEITVPCDFETLGAFLEQIGARDTFFALRRFRVENVSTNRVEELELTVVCGAGVIRESDPEVLRDPAGVEAGAHGLLNGEPVVENFGVTEEGETP